MSSDLEVFILAKDEAQNIERSVRAARDCGCPVTVLDSGSTDETCDIARAEGATVVRYQYSNHDAAYRDLCLDLVVAETAFVVIDADMLVSPELLSEGESLLRGGARAVSAPIRMYWEGKELRRGSLCPPKPFMFVAGQHYFEPRGHSEAVREDVRHSITTSLLVHDDMKPFLRYLESQVRYASNLLARTDAHGRDSITFRDKLRRTTPLLALMVPLFSYLVRGGIFAGKQGLGYAVDRFLAEAIMFRSSLAEQLHEDAGRRGD